MKRFFIKSALFIIPIYLLYGLTIYSYKTDRGDLLRIGYLMNNSNYRDILNEESENTLIYYDRISNNNKPKQYNVLVIGDSFSDREIIGCNTYVDYLSKNDSINLLLFDNELINSNPIQTLLDISNGDILNNIKVEYIILQSVERNFIRRIDKIKSSNELSYDSLLNIIQAYNREDHQITYRVPFFSSTVFKVPVYNILYHFTDKPFDSKTYKVATTNALFTGESNQLLFYADDLTSIDLNNNYNSILELNEILNLISNNLDKKGIKLIVLPSPDKYDMYYEYIVDKNNYLKPLFFDHFEKVQKDYLYVNSKRILNNAIKTKKDIYLYGDSHWSPKGAEIIASELRKIILKYPSTIAQHTN